MPFIFIYKDRYKIIISYLRVSLSPVLIMPSAGAHFPSVAMVCFFFFSFFLFFGEEKKNACCLSSAFLGALPVHVSLPPCPVSRCQALGPLDPLTFLGCGLPSERPQSQSRPWGSRPPTVSARKIGRDEQTQSQKETFFGFLSWKQ